MLRAGFDLGTTYSAVCLYDDVSKKTDYLKFDTCARDFFPSLISYSKAEPSLRYIGEAARRYRYSPKFDTYDTFKLRLGNGARDTDGRACTPFEVTRDFIGELLGKIRQFKGVRPEELILVQAVPDMWKNELQHTQALEQLADVYDGLGLDTQSRISFESEPVCAAAYYLNEICNGNYTGYLVVVDYGGGTLDMTLCRAEENGAICVLCSCGDGGSSGTGCAGNAFDREVTLALAKKYKLDEDQYQPGMPAFGALQSAFEDCKIASTENTRSALMNYYESGGFDDRLAFSVTMPLTYDDYDVYASDLAAAFEAANLQTLRQTVTRMQEHCAALDVNTNDIGQFRILLVGGFSNLHCVENCVREMFGSVAGIDDPRFDNRMNRESRSMAIAHGACLIAAGITPVEYINQTELGFYALDVMGREVAIPIVRKGEPVHHYSKPVFSPHSLIRPFREMPVSLTLYFDGGSGPVKIKMDELFSSLCPNYEQEDNTYRIGFSIDRHRIPHLHIRDASGAENRISLYKTVAQLPAIMIQP